MRLIDADKLTEEYIKLEYSNQSMGIVGHSYASEIARVGQQPTVDAVEIKHGKYSRSDEYTEQYGYLYKCSCCGVLGWAGNYCSNCGAKMEG